MLPALWFRPPMPRSLTSSPVLSAKRKPPKPASTRCRWLQPGSYRVSVQAEGFRALTREGIRLEVAQTAGLNFTLEVGATSESITVQENAALLEAGSNAIGGVFTT